MGRLQPLRSDHPVLASAFLAGPPGAIPAKLSPFPAANGSQNCKAARPRRPRHGRSGFQGKGVAQPTHWAPMAPASHPHPAARASLEPGGVHPCLAQQTGAKVTRRPPRSLAPAGQKPPLTGVDDGVHLQLGDIASEQGDLLVELLILLVLWLLHLRGHPWTSRGQGVGVREGPSLQSASINPLHLQRQGSGDAGTSRPQ